MNTNHDEPHIAAVSPELSREVSCDLLATMFDCVGDGVFAVNENWRIIAINSAALRTLGITRREAIGKPCHEVFRANICRDTCALRYTLDTGRPVVNLAIQIKDAHGRQVPVTISSSTLRDRKGKVVGGVETFRNLDQVKEYLREVQQTQPFADIVTGDDNIGHLFEILPTIARSESCILLSGETGTGKSLFARAIHNLSSRSDGPLVTVNCGAMPETLLESELFGYRAGAFTGATRDRSGRIAAAQGGTIFFDEIGDMPQSMQVKLLHFLQEHMYERLGDPRPISADVRVLAATNRDLTQLVAEGSFRRDLYYRVNVMSVEIPPLRDRPGDVPLLAQRFLERFSMSRGKHITGFAPHVMALLEHYDFPGNVRELENIVEHAYVMCPGPTVAVEHLPRALRGAQAPAPEGGTTSWQDVEADFLIAVLERHHWNRQATANELKIHKTTLLRKLHRLGVTLPRIDGRSAQGRRGKNR